MSDEEDATAQLLRLAGARAEVPDDRSTRVRERVRREWRAGRRRRALGRGAAAIAAVVAASVALLVFIRVNAPRGEAQPQVRILATAERIQGAPMLHQSGGGQADLQPLALSAPTHAGDVVETGAASRAAMRAIDGSSVRIDRQSRVRLIAPAVIELLEGAVYVDTSPGSRGFEVRTTLGTVRDLGTRFEVRLDETSLRLRVRAGTAEIHAGAGVISATAGTEATATARGVETRRIVIHGSEWEWAAGLAPGLAIEGRALGAFLDHLAGEEGWIVRYADPTLADMAARTVLHGSVDGLQAEDALRVALATSGLEYRLHEGELIVSKPDVPR